MRLVTTSTRLSSRACTTPLGAQSQPGGFSLRGEWDAALQYFVRIGPVLQHRAGELTGFEEMREALGRRHRSKSLEVAGFARVKPQVRGGKWASSFGVSS